MTIFNMNAQKIAFRSKRRRISHKRTMVVAVGASWHNSSARHFAVRMSACSKRSRCMSLLRAAGEGSGQPVDLETLPGVDRLKLLSL